MSTLLDQLNPEQQKAVLATEGPVLILAGAGSGKTRALTYRVAYLISEKSVAPDNILVLTFTNKAADEMMERIRKLLKESGKDYSSEPMMGTFHSFCAKILRQDGSAVGQPLNFTIYDEGEALDAVKEAMSTLSLPTQKTSPTSIRHTISSAKNELISALEYPQYARGYFQEVVAKVYLEYQKILEKNYAVDFDDLMLKVIKLLQNNPTVLTRYQLQYQYILVDEYQDTNPAQYLISKYLANRHRNICVVGDASQSIYSFRGADFRNIVNFQKDYPNARVFNLEQNYRSTQNILDAATAVISKNKLHPVLKLWTQSQSGDKIEVVEARNEIDEALFIISKLNPAQLSDYAILYRTNAQSRALEEQFLKSGIPYRLYGGVSFYERKEVKDVLCYLKLINNPKESVALKRAEKLGKGRLNKFFNLYQEISFNLSALTTTDILDRILSATGYLEYLDDGTEEGKNRIDNVKELLSVAETFPTLHEFLENVALVENGSIRGKRRAERENQNAVTMMTMHSAKGLEFPTVFIVGMEEGLFPHSRSMMDMNALEEERRLCYVGITRARNRLYLTYTRSRLFFGTRSNNLVSRFLSEIPENLIVSNTSFRDQDQFLDDISITRDNDEWLN